MKARILIILFLFVAGSCAKVPITGRRQISFLPEGLLSSMALTSYQEFLSENPVVGPSDPRAAMVINVGRKISGAVNKYLVDVGQSPRVDQFDWQFNLVENDAVNAWCMPGGKVVFYTGILPLTQDEDGLAVVMAHEIAHAVARHGNERMSQQLLVLAGGLTLDVALREKPELTRDIFLLSYGVGSTLGTLAYSRKHEYEADRLGMIFMAMAGYNPEAAIPFWERMLALQEGPAPPEFLSTHPGSRNRIKAAGDFLPEAMKYYQPTP